MEEQAKQANREVDELWGRVKALAAERDHFRERVEAVLGEFSELKTENRSLKESCRVLELENRDLVVSEKRLKEMLGNRNTIEEASSATQCGFDTGTAASDGRAAASDVMVIREPVQEPSVVEEDSEDEREAQRYALGFLLPEAKSVDV